MTTPEMSLTLAELDDLERHVDAGFAYIAFDFNDGKDFTAIRPDLKDLIAMARRAHLSAGGWREIETAPKDGRRILLGASEPTADHDVEIGWWREDYQGWYHDRYKLEGRTHWKPLTPSRGLWGESVKHPDTFSREADAEAVEGLVGRLDEITSAIEGQDWDMVVDLVEEGKGGNPIQEAAAALEAQQKEIERIQKTIAFSEWRIAQATIIALKSQAAQAEILAAQLAETMEAKWQLQAQADAREGEITGLREINEVLREKNKRLVVERDEAHDAVVSHCKGLERQQATISLLRAALAGIHDWSIDHADAKGRAKNALKSGET